VSSGSIHHVLPQPLALPLPLPGFNSRWARGGGHAGRHPSIDRHRVGACGGGGTVPGPRRMTDPTPRAREGAGHPCGGHCGLRRSYRYS